MLSCAESDVPMDKGSQGCIYSLWICKVQRRENNLAEEKPNLKAYTGCYIALSCLILLRGETAIMRINLFQRLINTKTSHWQSIPQLEIMKYVVVPLPHWLNPWHSSESKEVMPKTAQRNLHWLQHSRHHLNVMYMYSWNGGEICI